MINWLNIIFNIPWIIGAAIILTALSYGDWIAAQQNVRLGQVLAAVRYQISFSIGIVLICLGLALLTDIWWQRWLWIGFMALFGLLIIRAEGTPR